ncbi:class I SAM-dependent methyltransferase [Sphingomonas sp. 37zxx]|uniref:class I SAM-dependent methyltransferase n=1 Tax=Sphingomonas sp. 37zxx TaxID=1550073 RepID=UPI00053BE423|nr:class I SAM-dependent methyltransferase [Sphingomonas sp. 37zxx]
MTGAADWKARVGDNWAAEWQRTDRSFEGLDPHLVAAILAAAPPNGRALDLGCGAGATSLAIASARPDLAIAAVDLSPALVAVAQARTADLPNAEVFAGDVLDAGSATPFDLIFSRHGVMFFPDPAAAFARLIQFVRPGGALVFSSFRDRSLNGWATETAAALGASPTPSGGSLGAGPGPFAFADRSEVAEFLASAGWTAIDARPIDYAYRAGAGLDALADAVDFLRRIGPAAALIAAAAEPERPALVERLTRACADRLLGGVVDFPAAAWLWSAQAPR